LPNIWIIVDGFAALYKEMIKLRNALGVCSNTSAFIGHLFSHMWTFKLTMSWHITIA